MSERLQRYLDGELRREDLTPAELREATLYEAVIRETSDVSRSMQIPDLTAGVLARIQADDPPSLHTRKGTAIFRRITGWLWVPQPIRLRPAYALLAAVLLLLTLAYPREAVPVASKVFVQFRLDAPGAKTVRLAGNFTGWKPEYTLQEVAPGIWSILIPLDSGVYTYAFVVNEEQWLRDPAAPAVADGFGGVNSRLSVLLPGKA